MKSLLNMVRSENNKLTGLSRSLKSLDGALISLEQDAYMLKQQNLESLEQFTNGTVGLNDEIDALEDIKECVVEIQERLVELEGLVHPCGGAGWIEVVNISYSDPNVPCPDTWQNKTMTTTDTNIERRGCGRPSTTGATMDEHIYSVNGTEYDEVCGRIHGYAFDNPVAFRNPSSIDNFYLDGISVTHTPSPNREHIWSFAASTFENPDRTANRECPCDGGLAPQPTVVGENYFCESGAGAIPASQTTNVFHGDDLLWDGLGCSTEVCCTRQNPPYFQTYLASSTTDDISVRIMLRQDRDILVTHVELYIRRID